MHKSILSISLDSQIAVKNSPAWQRHREYAQYFENYTVVVLGQNNNNYKNEYHYLNLHVFLAKSNWKIKSVFRTWQVSNQCQNKYKFDLVLAQDPIATGLVAYLISQKFNIPFYLQFHGSMGFSKYWLKDSWTNYFKLPLIKFLTAKADAIRVVNSQIKQNILDKYLDKKVVFTPIATDVSYFYKKAVYKKNLKKLISVGRLIKSKNQIMLCRIFNKLIKKYPDLNLELIGEGEQRANLEKYIKLNGLNKNIKLLGNLNKKQIKIKLHQADIYIYASNHEGWGLVIVEALTSGLPIVSTNIGCVGFDLIIENKTGKVVPVDDGQSMSEALEELIKNPRQAYKLAQNGQKLLKNNYQTQKIKKQWIKFLKDK